MVLRRFRGHPYPEQFQESMDMPLFIGKPRIYLIASTPRSGSHYLGHLLANTGSFGVPLEYFNRVNIRYWRKRFGLDLDDIGLFQRIFSLRTTKNGWFGIKSHWWQFANWVNEPVFEMIQPISSCIFIYRQNILAQALSFARAKQTGEWMSGANARATPHYDYDLIVKSAKNIRNQNKAWLHYFGEINKLPVITASYEELINHPQEVVQSMCTFIDSSCITDSCISSRTLPQADSLTSQWRVKFVEDLKEEDSWILAPISFRPALK